MANYTSAEELASEQRALALLDRVTGGDGEIHGNIFDTLRDLARAGIVLDAEYLARLITDASRIGAKNALYHH